MSDITQRLEYDASCENPDPGRTQPSGQTPDAQAAENERLRAALQGLVDALPSAHLYDDPPPSMTSLAHKLLDAKLVAVNILRFVDNNALTPQKEQG